MKPRKGLFPLKIQIFKIKSKDKVPMLTNIVGRKETSRA